MLTYADGLALEAMLNKATGYLLRRSMRSLCAAYVQRMLTYADGFSAPQVYADVC
jgi:hypothetical protein